MYWYALFKALRPLSLSIALISCLTGVYYGYLRGARNYGDMVLVLAAGVLLQAGVNLINDFFEFKQRRLDEKHPGLFRNEKERRSAENIIFIIGAICFLATIPAGLYLVYRSGFVLLATGIVGFIGGYCYTGYPFSYKNRGLGVLFVFFLMGILMIGGSAYAVSGLWPFELVVMSIPVSISVSLILLSNELRDFEADSRYGLKTLTVRLGYRAGVVLYLVMSAGIYSSVIILYMSGYMSRSGLMALLPAVLLYFPLYYAKKTPLNRRYIVHSTMIHHIVFSIIYILVMR